nr:hypothetical protein [Tanacetum cinerariifolium]
MCSSLKKFKEHLFTSCVENGILQDSFEPSNDNTNVVNALGEPFVSNQDPSKNSSQSSPQINHHCCYGCGDPLEGIFCYYCTCKLCGNGAHYGYNCPSKVLIIPNPEPFNNQTIKELPPAVPSFDSTCYAADGNSFTYDSTSNLVHDSPNVFDRPPQLPLYSYEFCGNDARYGHYCTPQVLFIYPEPCYNQDFNFPQDFHDFQQQYLCSENYGVTHEAYQCQPMNEDYYHEQKILAMILILLVLINFIPKEKQIEEEQVANAQYWKIPACYDDDDDYTFAVTPNEPDNSLSMGDEHLGTILSFSDEDVPNKIFSNPLFDKEIISMKIDPHHFNAESDLIESFLNHDSSIISSSSKIDSLFDEFTGKLTLLKSIPLGINETNCDPEEETHFIKRLLYDNSSPRSPKEFVSKNSDVAIEYFSPSLVPVEDNDSLMKEIDLSFTSDYPMLPGIEEDDYDSKRDILILEELLSNDSLSLPKNESFHFDIPSSSRPPAKPPDGNTGILNVKVMGDISEQKVPIPRLMFTQSTIVPNQEKSPDLLSHLGLKAF